MLFKGSMPALVTPFRNGKVDEKAFVALVERQVAAGTHGLVVCGTTGEASTLSHEEHQAVVELCVKTAAGRVPVIAGAGSNSTDEAISLLQHAKAVGAHAALVVNPYYNRPTQEGVYAHYKTLTEAVQLPIFLYNVPGRTGSDMQPELIGRLSKLPNVIGIKDASADLNRIARHTALAGKDFIQISGEDGTAVGFNSQGGVGCISVTANVAPRLCAQFQAASLAGDTVRAHELNERLFPLHQALFTDASPGPVKYALTRVCDWLGEEVRLPLIPCSAESRRAVDAALEHAGLV